MPYLVDNAKFVKVQFSKLRTICTLGAKKTESKLGHYRNPTTLDTNTVRYTFDRTSKAHTVRHDTKIGQEAPASIKRFSSIHMAEAEMVRLRALLSEQGYTDQVK